MSEKYEELAKRLREATGWKNASEHYSLMKEAADAIEELDAKVIEWQEEACRWNNEYYYLLDSMPRWIPVTETPPRKVGDDGYNGYLVYANGYYKVSDYTTDKFDNVPYFHVDGEYEPDVTHYMPLPEPPKECPKRIDAALYLEDDE